MVFDWQIALSLVVVGTIALTFFTSMVMWVLYKVRSRRGRRPAFTGSQRAHDGARPRLKFG